MNNKEREKLGAHVKQLREIAKVVGILTGSTLDDEILEICDQIDQLVMPIKVVTPK